MKIAFLLTLFFGIFHFSPEAMASTSQPKACAQVAHVTQPMGDSAAASAWSCNKDVDCGIEERCIGGECVPFSGFQVAQAAAAWSCNKDVDCGIEERCIGGECVPFSGLR